MSWFFPVSAEPSKASLKDEGFRVRLLQEAQSQNSGT